MGEGIYGYLSSMALISYLFMFFIFMNAEKNKSVNAFLLLLLSMIFWTGGSLLMRIQMWPSYIFWYHMSFGGLLLIVFSYFRFIVAFVGERKSTSSLIYFVALMACFLINIPKGIILHWPDVVPVGDKVVMVYDAITGFLSILVVITAIVIVHMLWVLFTNFGSSPKLKKQTMPIVLGIFILFIGNIAVVLPLFRGFPIDIVSGVLNSLLLMYALGKKQLFKLKMKASDSIGYILCIALGFTVFYGTLPYLDRLLIDTIHLAARYHLPLYLIFFISIVTILFQLFKKVVSDLFVKDEENQNEILKKFSSEVSKTLKLNDIFEKTVSSIGEATGIRKIYIGISEHETDDYVMRYSDESLADLSFVMRKDNPIIHYVQKYDECMIMDEFVHSVEYKSMWESEKMQMARLNVSYCVGLKENNTLNGIILFSDFGRKSKLRKQDISIINSIASIASIAIKNAHTYEKAYLEARTDELTGALNRRYFYEVIQETFEKNIEGSLALVIISVDDFKLFNQLYGVKQGDITLKNIADIMKASIGDNGYIARYSGKEFALLLPNYDVFSAKRLTESIRDQIANIGSGDGLYRQKRITISAGISISPYGAKTVKELIDNAEHAVYQVKRKGKNAISVFDTFVIKEKSLSDETDYTHVYDEYKSTIYALTAAIDAKDHYTFSHSDNVSKYAVALARKMNLNSDIVENIRQAALLHDIGKIGIPEHILNKPGKLTESEYIIMQGHVEASIDIIRHLPSLDYVIPAVLGHHERYDGRGYPRRIAGEDIPLTARILCIADSFDAMVSIRCYKPEIPLKEAMDQMVYEAGRQFDPSLVTLFVSMIKNGEIEVTSNDRLERVDFHEKHRKVELERVK